MSCAGPLFPGFVFCLFAGARLRPTNGVTVGCSCSGIVQPVKQQMDGMRLLELCCSVIDSYLAAGRILDVVPSALRALSW